MIVRRVLGTLAGVVVSTAVIMTVEWLGHAALGDSAGDGGPPQLTPAMFAVVIVGWTLGAYLGGCAGVALARWRGAAWIVGGLVALGILANQLSVPQPLWVSAAGICLALLAAKLAASSKGKPQRVAL